MDAPPVQYVRTSDGVSIAYSVAGKGTSLLLPPFIHSHVQLNWQNDLVIVRRCRLLRKLMERFRVLTFDNRGQGLSARGLPESLTLADLDLDTEAVAGRVEDETFVFVACARSSHLAIRYLIKHPERVSALVLISAQMSMGTLPSALFELLPDQNWEFFLQTQLLPGLPPQDVRAAIDMLKQTSTPEDYRMTWTRWRQSDVTDLLPAIRTPTLVLHAREFPFVKPEEATRLAALIPNARLGVIDGYEILGNADQAAEAIEGFLADLPSVQSGRGKSPRLANGLSGREVEVLRLLAAGKSNQEIADELVISLNTVRRHVSNIFDKTGVANRAQATAYAKDHGLA
jgi:pimeloyl-ACP methyl ester carboxylesterase/DNA-binding CsgD family transcriptional regulator